MTHEQVVEIANEIFAAIKDRQDLTQMDEAARAARPYPESDIEEIYDYMKDLEHDWRSPPRSSPAALTDGRPRSAGRRTY